MDSPDFLQNVRKGLAYEAEVAVNRCPALGNLANEEVIDGKSELWPSCCKPMKQWMLKITAYAGVYDLLRLASKALRRCNVDW